MKRILIIALVLLSTLGYSQRSEKNFTVRNKLTVANEFELDDSSVVAITTGDTLVTKEWTEANTLSMTGNDTEVFFNNGGILGSNPSFTYDTTEHILNIDTLKLGIGESVSWNGDEYTLNIETGLGPVLQVGQEIYILIYNNTGQSISNTMALRPVSAVDVGGILFPTVEKAIANVFSGVEGTIMVSTMDIPDGTVGVAVRFGRARGTNTSGFSPGDALWVSAVDSGVIVNVRPEFPNYDISIGGSFNSAAAPDGEIFISVTRDIFNTFNNFWNGVFRETFDFLVTESGGVITGTLTPADGHPNMTMIFSDGFTVLDTDPGATIVLTAGTDVNPQTNFVYIPEATKVLTISTSDWPTTEHIKVAQVFLQTAVTTGTDGALRNQNWNDHIQSTTTNQGHLSHITEKLRQFEAQWDSGAEGTSTIDIASTPDDVWVSNTSGVVYQLHKQTFPVFDTETGNDVNIVNHPTTPYTSVTNLNTQLLDANGITLNNQSFSFVMWGVMNKSGDSSHVMINLPIDSYAFASPDNAVSDALNYSVYEIPKAFQGVGFLIARFTYTYKNDDWVLYDTEDLRGRVPNTTAGGGGGGTGVTTFLGLTDTESSYTAYELQVANAGATALETSTGMRYFGDSLVVDNNSIVHGNIGIGITDPLSALHINKGTGISNGLNLGTTLGNGFSLFGTDAVSGFAGNKEIFRLVENVTEQFIINPQGDLTGTAAAPSLAFGGGGVFNTGFLEVTDNNLELVTNGVVVAYWNTAGMQSRDNFPLSSNTYDLGSPTRFWEELWINNINNSVDVSVNINSIEAMRLTEDTVLMDSSAHIGKDLFIDGNVGIGTSTPNELLHILSSTNSSVLEVQSTFIGGDSRLNLYADNTGLSQLRFGDQDDVNIGLITYDHSDNSMALRTNNATSISIDSNGDVGINDVTPTFKLDVNGTGRFTGIVNFDVFPITPSSAPTTDYEVANKKYVDDNVAGSGIMQIASAEIVYTNTSQTTIVTVPSGSIIWDMGVNVSAIFDGTGTNFLDIGTTATPNLITDDFDKLGTVHFPTFLTQNWSGTTVCPIVVGATNITFTYIDQNSDATQGAAIIYIHYFIP